MSRRRRVRYDPTDDLYTVLGVQPSATADEIRRSFRQKAKAVHPDHNPDNADWAHQQFQRLNEAYDILNDPALRTEYDQRRSVYHRHRGPDGLAWWERPNPTASGRAASSGIGVPYTATYRRPTWSAIRRKDRQRTHAYQVLFLLSSLMLAGSLCAWMLGGPGNYGEGTTNVVVVADPQPGGAPVGEPLCSNTGALITAPANGVSVSGRFAVEGTASSSQFAWYTLEIASLRVVGPAVDTTPVLVASSVITWMGSTPVVYGLLVPDWVIGNLAPGDYLLRLTVARNDGKPLAPCEVRFHHSAS